MMRKLCVLALALAAILLPPAADSASAADGDTGTVTGLYEGNIRLEGLALQIHDGRKRHFIYVDDGRLPSILRGRIGRTIRVDFREEKLDPKTAETLFGERDFSLLFARDISLVPGRDDPELCKVREKAEAEDAQARNTLGVWYEKGRHGLPRDPEEAVHWYSAAADGGSSLAMHNLGDCHRDGIGVPRDEAMAEEWYNRAIAAGNPIGYEDLGDLRMRGGRHEEARAMYMKAAGAGRESARKKLEKMGR